MSFLSAVRQDIGRYEGKSMVSLLISPTFMIVLNYRMYSAIKNNKLLVPLSLLFRLNHKILTYITGIQFSLNCKIGPGLFFPHHGTIVIAGDCVIGENVTILQDTTIGRSFGKTHGGCPTIGDSVLILGGAKVFGPITIGSHCVIGANSVVTKSTPDYSVVVGVPARVMLEDSRLAFDDYWGRHFRILE